MKAIVALIQNTFASCSYEDSLIEGKSITILSQIETSIGLCIHILYKIREQIFYYKMISNLTINIYKKFEKYEESFDIFTLQYFKGVWPAPDKFTESGHEQEAKVDL